MRRIPLIVFGLSIAFAVMPFALSGCSTVSDQAHRLYIDEPLPPKDPSDVQILFTRPNRQFTVIADLQARGASPEYMRKEAAKIGADAVIVSLLGGERSYSDEWASENTKKTYSRITGTAILFR